jgi:hypothetical protein
MTLRIVPVFFKQARDFVARHHRHHKPPVGHVFSVAVEDEAGTIRGVAMVGRPVARGACDGFTLEVNRCCTDGAPNACSMLYGACWRAAKALGYRKLITYTLDSEPGTSLLAAGFKYQYITRGTPFSSPSRPRQPTLFDVRKKCWCREI